jgi:hypothetical protein
MASALHTLFITNRAGGLIYSKELSSGARLAGNEYLLLASTFHSLHAISKQLAPVPSGGLQCVEAPAFTMHCMESPTGIKFFATARPGTRDVPAFLKRVYAFYSDYVLKNPFYEVDMPIRLKVRANAARRRPRFLRSPPPPPPRARAPPRRLPYPHPHPRPPALPCPHAQLFDAHVEGHAKALGLVVIAPPAQAAPMFSGSSR